MWGILAGNSMRQKTLMVSILIVLLLVPVTGITQIRKPTTFIDVEGATTNPANAFDFAQVYNGNTSSQSTGFGGNASINWTGWDTTNIGVYSALSLTVTLSGSNFVDDSWFVYYDNTSDTVCDGADRLLVSSNGVLDNPTETNYTVQLPRTQSLSQLSVCLVGTINSLSDGGTINMFDIRTNGTVDTTAPEWRNQQQNRSRTTVGSPLNLDAQGFDAVNLSTAILATNETGTWQNKTGNYSSPVKIYQGGVWTWTNFTWNNASMSPGTTVGWRIWYNDTGGNVNRTSIKMFRLRPPVLNVALVNPPTPFTATLYQTFTLNATVTCLYADCGQVTGSAQYNTTGTAPDTLIPQSSGTPFHTAKKSNPLVCDTALLRGETCNLTWQINATGADGSMWNIDVNATSDVSTVRWNDTTDAEVQITAFAIDILLRWPTIDFSNLFVGTADNPAINNSDAAYNITVTSGTTTNVDLWANMTDLSQENGHDVIGASNMSASTQNDPSTAHALKHAFSRLTPNVAPGTNVTTYYWLDTPLGIFADNYTGVMWVTANATG